MIGYLENNRNKNTLLYCKVVEVIFRGNNFKCFYY